MEPSKGWYVVQQENGECAIAPASEIVPQQAAASPPARWGPYDTQAEAVSRRVGLIRAGKCKPV